MKSSHGETNRSFIPRVFAVFVVVYCFLVILGWHYDIASLRSVVNLSSPIKPMAAFCFVLLGISVLFFDKQPVYRRDTFIITFLCVNVISISTLSLAQYFLGINWVDMIRFLKTERTYKDAPPGSIAPVTAINFLFLSLSILSLFYFSPWFKRNSKLLMLFCIVSSFQTMAGYFIGLASPFGTVYTKMAFDATIVFLLLSMAIIKTRYFQNELMSLWSGGSTGRLTLQLMALGIFIPLVFKLLQIHGESVGYLNQDWSAFFQFFGNIILIVIFVWATSTRLSESDFKVQKTEENFKNIQSQLKSFADALPALVAYVDAEEKYLFTSKPYEEWFGKAVPAGTKVADFLGEEKYRDAKPYIDEVLAGKAVSYETKWVLPGDKIIFIKASYTPDIDENGKVKGAFVMVNDITELKLAIEARDTFLKMASHELKTPITSMLLRNGQAIRKLSKDIEFTKEDLLAMLQKDKSNIERLAQLIESMLDIESLKDKQIKVEMKEFDLSRLIDEIQQTFEPQFLEARVTLTIYRPHVLYVNWDRFRIEQAISNLLTNALKFGRGTDVELSVERQGSDVLIKVTDNGIGIQKEDQIRIFNKFERAVGENQPTGFGLGLFLVKNVVSSHHGEISVESEPMKGSTFTLKVPVETGENSTIRFLN